MKHAFKNLLAVLTAACLLILAGCSTPDSNATTASTLNEDNTLRDKYIQATQYVSNAENFFATITEEKSTTTGGFTFRESTVQEFSYLHHGTDYMLADLKETYTVGDHTVSITEHFDSGVCALQIEEAGFVSALSCSQYAARFAPLLLINEELYQSVSASTENELTVLTFSEASAPESWTGIDQSCVIRISAQAVINADGRLVESRYSISYRSGTAVIESSVTSSLNTDFVPTLLPFPDTSGFVEIANPDIPKLLEQATGYVLQASAVTSGLTESITCQAGGLFRKQDAVLDLLSSDSDLKARLERNIQLVDYTQNASTSNSAQVELFLNGGYYLNGEALTDSTIDTAHMLTYCRDTLVFPILLPKYITGMTVTEEGDRWILEFDTTRALSDVICANACQALYKNPDILNNLASSYAVNYTSGYLVLDKDTGLPMEASLRYSGTHTIAGYAYELSYELTQTYDLTSQTAQDAILADAPEAPAVPPETTAPSVPA